MSKVVFEVATISDAIRKAEKIAPDRGAAFDKAAGIVMELYPAEETVILRATNLDVYYMEWIDALEVSGDPVVWRLPSRVLAGIISSLPIASGRTVAFETTEGRVKITSGKMRCHLNRIDPTGYPEWYPFEEDNLTPCPELGGRLSMVEWAASKTETALGLRFTGTHVMAADRYSAARTTLEIANLKEPITIPRGILSGVIKPRGDTKIGVTENQLWIMPDPTTQIRTIILSEGYPPMTTAFQPLTDLVRFKKSALIDMIGVVMKIVGADRQPTMELIIGKQTISVSMSDDGHGTIGDTIEVPGADHPRMSFFCNPSRLQDLLTNSPSDEVILQYQASAARPVKLLVDGGSGYEGIIMLRAKPKE